MTVREIAKLAGVSPATVSRYLTGTEKVNNTSAEKIKSIIGESDSQITSRTKQKSNLIGVLVAKLDYEFYHEVLREIIFQSPNYGFQPVFIPTAGNEKQDLKALLAKLNLEGVIILDEDIHEDILDLLAEQQLKMVICGAAAINSQAAMVHINDLAAAYNGTKYLIGLGHKRIAFLSDFTYSISSGFQRLAGRRKALEEAGLQFDEKLIRCGVVVYESGYVFTQELIKSKADFTAIFAFSDEMALGAINALHDAGLSVPDDISVLGFDNLPFANYIRPMLTTIRQPIDDIVKNTLEILANPKSNMVNTAITLPYSIYERESCSKIDK